MGRTPDHVAGFLAGYAAKPSRLCRSGKPVRPITSCGYHASARDTISTSPTPSWPRRRSRSKPAHKQSAHAPCRVVAEARTMAFVLERRAAARHRGGVFDAILYKLHPSACPGR